MFASSHSTVSSTNTTSEEILASILIPGGTLASGDTLHLNFLAHLLTGSAAGTKTLRVRLHTASATAGTAYFTSSTTSVGNISWHWLLRIAIKGASSQEGSPVGTGPYGVHSNAPITSSLAIASDMYLLITSQKATGTDTLTLNHYDLEIKRAP